MTDAVAEVRALVERLTKLWRDRRYDEIAEHVEPEVVIATPAGPVRGRAAYVQSFRDYDAAAETLEFETDEPAVDVVGDVAVATTSFRVTYELDGTTHRERGRDLLVFARTDRWRVAWRTVSAEFMG